MNKDNITWAIAIIFYVISLATYDNDLKGWIGFGAVFGLYLTLISMIPDCKEVKA